MLFGLPKVLRYKAKPGRDLDLLRSELLSLMTLVAGVVSTEETWAGLRHQVENATRKSQLRHVEDQVDAVLCAYLAHFVHHRRDLTTCYGDLGDRLHHHADARGEIPPARAGWCVAPCRRTPPSTASSLELDRRPSPWCGDCSTRPASTTCQ